MLAIVKECEKNAKKLTLKDVLNGQKNHEILQNSKILLNPKYKMKSSNWQSFARKGS